jgi:hypothetical protein
MNPPRSFTHARHFNMCFTPAKNDGDEAVLARGASITMWQTPIGTDYRIPCVFSLFVMRRPAHFQ